MSAVESGSGLIEILEPVYGTRASNIVESLKSIGPRYYFRLNSLTNPGSRTLESMRLAGLKASRDERISDAGYLPAQETPVENTGTPVVADRYAAEAVLQGAHLYARGVKNCHGLRRGTAASIIDKSGTVAGTGLARQSEASILTYRTGLAVQVTRNRSGLPSLMDTEWYEKGYIHLQSLPAIVTCHVLDPQPGDLIVDMNCAPGGKTSYVCQLTENKATVIGFDRNMRKIDKTRKQLERLGCRNYQLMAHDSRYAHLDYDLRPDKVLVDPPCTGLGVMPRLSFDITEKDVNNLASYQKQFLTSASHLVKPGGTIVYSVCTMPKEECEEAVQFATENLDLTLDEATPMIGGPGMNPWGFTQRFHPDLDGSGYFIAKFSKKH